MFFILNLNASRIWGYKNPINKLFPIALPNFSVPTYYSVVMEYVSGGPVVQGSFSVDPLPLTTAWRYVEYPILLIGLLELIKIDITMPRTRHIWIAFSGCKFSAGPRVLTHVFLISI